MVFPYLDRFTKGGIVPKTHRKSIPVGHKRPETLAEQVARLVRSSEFARTVAAQGLETFEEADDFDVDDEHALPNTPWEKHFDLAAVGGMEGGVVKTPSPEELAKSRSTLEKVKNAVYKRKSDASATPPAKSAAGAPAAPSNASGDPAAE